MARDDFLVTLQNVCFIIILVQSEQFRTRDIATQCGARLDAFEWIDDFAAARNHALNLARGEWILYIDADERMRAASSSQLRSQLSNPSYVGHYVLLHPRRGYMPYWEMRLFRNHPHIRFRGVIHETIWPALDAYRATHGGRIGRSSLVLDHEGYEGDQEHKHQQNLPLLRKALQEDPSRVFSWCHLARIYGALGQDDLARQAWHTGLDVVRQKGRLGPEDCLPYIGLVQWEAARGRDVEALLTEAMRRFPHNHSLQWLCGKALLDKGRITEAIPYFERLLACGETGDIDRSMAYDVRLFNVFAYESLATCYFRLGRFTESSRYFDLAVKHAPDTLEYRVKRVLSSQLARKQPRVSSDGG